MMMEIFCLLADVVKSDNDDGDRTGCFNNDQLLLLGENCIYSLIFLSNFKCLNYSSSKL